MQQEFIQFDLQGKVKDFSKQITLKDKRNYFYCVVEVQGKLFNIACLDLPFAAMQSFKGRDVQIHGVVTQSKKGEVLLFGKRFSYKKGDNAIKEIAVKPKDEEKILEGYEKKRRKAYATEETIKALEKEIKANKYKRMQELIMIKKDISNEVEGY